MSPTLIVSVLLLYFLMLITIAHFTRGSDDNAAFFTGNRNSRWYVVAFGMIGASLSGVTFISVPGWVGESGFSYMQMVLGYFLGYLIIAFVLLPLYYRHNLTSIYVYLGERFGPNTHLVGTLFFLVSRLIGSALRLFLVADVLHHFVFAAWGLPFFATVLITLVLIWIYTHRGGIKTIIWTDTIQTIFMLLALGVGIYLLASEAGVSNNEVFEQMRFSNWWVLENSNVKDFWWKHLFGGMFVTIAMTGLDQDMMQKNLSCRNVKDAKKNMLLLSVVLIVVNLIFLMLGAYLYQYMNNSPEIQQTISSFEDAKQGDMLFPTIALSGKLGYLFGVIFIIGLIAAAYSSADSAITALTTSVCFDVIKIDKKFNPDKQESVRKKMHIVVVVSVFITIMLAEIFKEQNVISTVFNAANFTYGPLLGLFFFGIFTKRRLNDKYAWLVCLLIPIVLYFIKQNESAIFGSYNFGYELLGINGLLCFIALFLVSQPKNATQTN